MFVCLSFETLFFLLPSQIEVRCIGEHGTLGWREFRIYRLKQRFPLTDVSDDRLSDNRRSTVMTFTFDNLTYLR